MSDSAAKNLVPKNIVDKNGVSTTRYVNPAKGETSERAAGAPAPKASDSSIQASDITSLEGIKAIGPQGFYPATLIEEGGKVKFGFADLGGHESFLEAPKTRTGWDGVKGWADIQAGSASTELDGNRWRMISDAIDTDDIYSIEAMTEAKKFAEEQSGLSLTVGAMQAVYQYGSYIEEYFPDATPQVKAEAMKQQLSENIYDAYLDKSADAEKYWTAFVAYDRGVHMARVQPLI